MYVVNVPLKDEFRDDLYQVASLSVLNFVLLEAVFNIVHDYFGMLDTPVPDSIADEYFAQSIDYIAEAIRLTENQEVDEESQFVLHELLAHAISAIMASMEDIGLSSLEPVWVLTLNPEFTRDINFTVHHGNNCFSLIFLNVGTQAA